MAHGTPPIPTSSTARPVDTLEERPSDSSITLANTPAWTEQDEQELVDIKAKLHQAHKTWSADQELWHDRHEELEELKRKYLKAEKKKSKAAKKDAAGDEGFEASKLSKALRRVSVVPSTLVPRRRSNTLTPGNASGSTTPGNAPSGSATEDDGPMSRGRSNSSSISDIASRLGHLRAKSLGGGKKKG